MGHLGFVKVPAKECLDRSLGWVGGLGFLAVLAAAAVGPKLAVPLAKPPKLLLAGFVLSLIEECGLEPDGAAAPLNLVPVGPTQRNRKGVVHLSDSLLEQNLHPVALPQQNWICR